jgi:hypothetical protein
MPAPTNLFKRRSRRRRRLLPAGALVRAPGDEIGDEERQRNLEGDEQRERGEQDRDRLPDGQLARWARGGVNRHGRSASSACAKMPGGCGGSWRG